MIVGISPEAVGLADAAVTPEIQRALTIYSLGQSVASMLVDMLEVSPDEARPVFDAITKRFDDLDDEQLAILHEKVEHFGGALLEIGSASDDTATTDSQDQDDSPPTPTPPVQKKSAPKKKAAKKRNPKKQPVKKEAAKKQAANQDKTIHEGLDDKKTYETLIRLLGKDAFSDVGFEDVSKLDVAGLLDDIFTRLSQDDAPVNKQFKHDINKKVLELRLLEGLDGRAIGSVFDLSGSLFGNVMRIVSATLSKLESTELRSLVQNNMTQNGENDKDERLLLPLTSFGTFALRSVDDLPSEATRKEAVGFIDRLHTLWTEEFGSEQADEARAELLKIVLDGRRPDEIIETESLNISAQEYMTKLQSSVSSVASNL